MQPEIEAMFGAVDKELVRARLKEAGATLVRPEYAQKRTTFDLPLAHHNKWIRVRDEGTRVTLAYKEAGSTMEEQQELEMVVDSYDAAVTFAKLVGCTERSMQEMKRELWTLDSTEVTIDTWPFLEPLVEIEGKSEGQVRAVAEKLGFDYSQALFGTVNLLYKAKYGIFIEDLPPERRMRMGFGEENPFIS